MNLSWNWLSEYVDLSQLRGPSELAELLTSLGLEVESIREQGKGLDHVVVAQVDVKEKHPDADRLSVCKVNNGSEILDIVCGAQNFKQGDRVVLAQVGALLPNGMKIKSGKIRGQISNGMLCSEAELGLADDAEGILVLNSDFNLGQPFKEAWGLDDTVLELGITPNRGDCLSHVGIAREVSAALGVELKKPEVKPLPSSFGKIKTKIQTPLASQFYGIEISGVQVGPSPLWLKKRLESVGLRSISNVVDASNYVLMELGQPTHAYDLNCLKSSELSIQTATSSEMTLLDGQTISLEGGELVIHDGTYPVSLAGVMGGGDSQVTNQTNALFIEGAQFDPVAVRKSAKKFNLHSDASHRFERGIDPQSVDYATARLVELILKVAGGEITGVHTTVEKEFKHHTIEIPFEKFKSHLGMSLEHSQVEQILARLGCEVSVGEPWKVKVPSHRNDLLIPEDLTEEVARSIGYDQIPATVPRLTELPTPRTGNSAFNQYYLVEKAKDILAELGLSEVVQYPFCESSRLGVFGLESKIRVQNPLSEENEVMVPSLIPGLLQTAQLNWNHHFGSEKIGVRIFEMRPTFHLKGDEVRATSETETGVNEAWRCSFLLSGPEYLQGLRNKNPLIDFYSVKGLTESFFEKLGTKGVRMMPFSDRTQWKDRHLFHPGRSVEVWVGKESVGCIGALHPAISQRLKLKNEVWLGDLNWDSISKMSMRMGENRKYKAWNEFPGMERDFAVLANDEILAQQIVETAMKAAKPLAKTVKVFDIYSGSQVSKGMTSVAVRVIFSIEGRSLKESEVDEASHKILEAWKNKLGVELRS
ncbi:MAG: phenylalanine--tRNA ligase subunit beta [Bdellovibrionaceae bacterium]|nr:phenylalanine--tRNA ligase subunit beta [Pseudobdellovibrionaceae bacterium]|tara:strand:- start:2764 stop:5214 length:2451 start_codon:yes stop_codon:yes gene_type:complete